MKRPWQVWLLFAACVLGAFSGMAWLTREAMHADRMRHRAESDAELEQRVSLALWRMDTKLAPIIAEEVIRPPADYRPTVSGPLELPPYVLLQFEVRPDGQWLSPQMPAAKAQQLPQLVELSRAIKFEKLLPQLPDTPLPSLADINRSVAANADAASTINSGDKPFQFVEGNGANAPPQQSESGPAGDDVQQQAVQQPAQAANVSDLQQRSQRYQTAAQQSLKNAMARGVNDGRNTTDSTAETGKPILRQPSEKVGVSRPVWVGSRLLLARRVSTGKTTVVQGCWLDWPRLRSDLLSEANDLLADLGPCLAQVKASWTTDQNDPTRMLAGLPVRLMLNGGSSDGQVDSTLYWALWIGWGAVVLAVLAAAAMLHGVMTLSERRAAFVSSVTHELRTPLTTFRMYAEMLAKGMVPDAARRQEYFNTLQREAERLTLLVENVLAYARLERGRKPQAQDRVTLAGLFERIGPRLQQRAKQAGMECELCLDQHAARDEFTTDQAVVEQILFNLVDNASKYAREAADRRIHVEANRNRQFVNLTVRDHGPGMKNGLWSRHAEPFTKSAQESAESAPGVGLGLALCRRLARELGGRLEVDASSSGTTATLFLCIHN